MPTEETAFVPADFVVPTGLASDWCELRPLAVSDNDGDFAAWQSSVDHIAATPGYVGRAWPVHEYAIEQNAHDLAEHEADFAARRGFTYTVVDPANETIGCVYIYPPENPADTNDTEVRSWVRTDHAGRDADLYRLVIDWVSREWPFTSVTYAPR